MMRFVVWSAMLLSFMVIAAGCKRPVAKVPPGDGKAVNEVADTGSPDSHKDGDSHRESIIGRTTSEIGEFNPDSGAQVSDSKIDENRLSTPLVGSLAAYGPMVERISKLYIEQAINLFYAEHGRYPKSYEEFMEKIIRANNIELPVLPGNAKYQYDVENHRLEVVEDKPAKN